MITERMEYEIVDRFGEFATDEDITDGKYTPLQLAFESLAYRRAFTKQEKGRLDSEQDKKCWETITKVFDLPMVSARLLFEIAYQCPKEFRIVHLTKASQAMCLEHINILIHNGFVNEGIDFYSKYYELSEKFMRTVVFGAGFCAPDDTIALVSGPIENLFTDFDK